MNYSDRIIPSRERTRTRLNLPSKGISKPAMWRSSLYSSNRDENRYSTGITADTANNNGIGSSFRSKASLSSLLPSVSSRSRTSLGLNSSTARPESPRPSMLSSRTSAGIMSEESTFTDKDSFGRHSSSRRSGSKPKITATTNTTDNAVLPGSLPNFFDSSNLNNNNWLNHNLTSQRSNIRERLLNRPERPKTQLPLSYRKKPKPLGDYDCHQHSINASGYNGFDKIVNNNARSLDIGRLRSAVPINSVSSSSSASRSLYPNVQKTSHSSSLSSKYLGDAAIGSAAYDDLFANRQRFSEKKELGNLPNSVNKLKFDRLPKMESNQKPPGNYDAKDDIIEAGEEFLLSDNDINTFQSQEPIRQHQQSQVTQQHEEHTGPSILRTLVSKLSSFFKPPENTSDYKHVHTSPGSSGAQVRAQQGETEAQEGETKAQKTDDKQSKENYSELDSDSDLERKQRNKKLNELIRKEKKKKKKLKKLMKKSRKSNNEELDIDSREHSQQIRHESTDPSEDKGKKIFLKQKTVNQESENKVRPSSKERESKKPDPSYGQALRKKRRYVMDLGVNPSLHNMKKQKPNPSKETPNIFLKTEPNKKLGLNFLKNNKDNNSNFSSLEEQKTAKKSISSTPDSNSEYTKHDSSMTSHDSKNNDLIDNKSSSKDPSLRQQSRLEELKQKDQVISILNNKINLLENSLIDIQKSLQLIREKQEQKSNQPGTRKKYEKSRQRLEHLVSSTPALSVVDKSELLEGLEKITADDVPENGESPQIKKRMSVREKLNHEVHLRSKSKSSIFSNDSQSGSQRGKEELTEGLNENKDVDVTITKTPDVIIEDFKKISERIYERERSLAESSRNGTNNSRNLQQQEAGLADQYSKSKQYKQQLEEELQEVEKSQLTNQAVIGVTSSSHSHGNAGAPESDDEFDETNIDETLAKIEKSMGGLSPIKVSFRE